MGILDGIRVIELSRTLAGPWAGQVLADLGADVVKIEQPGAGDESRSFTPPSYRGQSCYFQSANRNKSSVVLDLKSESDRERLYDMVAQADIVTESFRTGVAERLKIDYHTLIMYKPDLIYLSVSGYGRTGSRDTWPAYDIVMQAETGLMSTTGTADGHIVKIGPSIVDISTGLYAAIGLLGALYERTRSGQGQYLGVAMFDTQFSVMSNWVLSTLETGVDIKPMGTGNPALAPYQLIQAADGQYMLGVANDRHWRNFCEAVGLQQLEDDPRFRTNADRVGNRDLLIEIIENRIAEMTVAELDDALKRTGVPGAKVNTIREIQETPFFAERKILQPMESDPSTLTVKFPVEFSRTPIEAYRLAPQLGGDCGES